MRDLNLKTSDYHVDQSAFVPNFMGRLTAIMHNYESYGNAISAKDLYDAAKAAYDYAKRETPKYKF